MTAAFIAFAADHVLTIVWLKATLFLSLVLVIHLVARRWSAGQRAAAATIAAGGLVALPAGHYALPQSGPPMMEFPVFLFRQSPADVVAWLGADGVSFWLAERSIADWIAIVWIAGIAGLLARLAWQTRRLTRIAARAERLPGAGGGAATVLLTPEIDSPLTFGWRRPRILLPADAAAWSVDATDAVLTHELAHIRRHDYLALMLTEIIKAIYWLNPLAWRFAAAVRAELENACDDAVLGSGVAPADYVRHLLAMARRDARPAAPVALPMVRRSHFRARIAAILDGGINRRVATAHDVIAAAAVSFALASSLAGAGIWCV